MVVLKASSGLRLALSSNYICGSALRFWHTFSGKKKAHKHKLFGLVGLAWDDPGFVPGTNPVVPGTNPVVPGTDLGFLLLIYHSGQNDYIHRFLFWAVISEYVKISLT